MTTTRTKPGPAADRVRGGSARRLVRITGWTMVWTGGLVLALLAYQLWGTGLYTEASQDRLSQQLTARIAADAVPAPPTEAAGPEALNNPSPAALSTPTAPQLIGEGAPGEGEALGWIRIPVADVDHVVVSGVSPEVLKLGPGHMPWTPLPGQPGNAVVSGHRTTYGAPFFDLDLLEMGDAIYVETAIGTHTYQVREILVVEPTDVWVTDPRPGAWLTLVTCTPRYSAAQRLIIAAELVDGPNLVAIEATRPGGEGAE